MGLLDGKVVIVTGGGHGIGKAYCLGIARESGTAVVADIDDKAADGVAKAIKDSGGKALATNVDVANFASCQEMAKNTLDAYGKIDGLVNNAAIFMSVPAEKGSWQEITEEAWDRMMAVNVKGLWLCSRAVVPAMQKRKQGSVVNISSNMAFNGGLTNDALCYVESCGGWFQPRSGARAWSGQHSRKHFSSGRDDERRTPD